MTTLQIGVPIASLLLLMWSACDTGAAIECDVPGESIACTCTNGRVSRQVCTAHQTWGSCYCDPQACGDGDLDDGEQCDDNNNDPGDGCNQDCEIETASNNVGGNGPISSTGAGASSSTGMGGMPQGGGGNGGNPGGAGGMGGQGGN
jgi:cysteine-rich repeat protein